MAEENNKIIGLLLGEFKNSLWLKKSHVAHISNFGINKDNRRKGIGQQLMNTFLALCKEKNIDEIRLGVYNKNIPAYKFYENYGFTPLQQTMALKIEKNQKGELK